MHLPTWKCGFREQACLSQVSRDLEQGWTMRRWEALKIKNSVKNKLTYACLSPHATGNHFSCFPLFTSLRALSREIADKWTWSCCTGKYKTKFEVSNKYLDYFVVIILQHEENLHVNYSRGRAKEKGGMQWHVSEGKKFTFSTLCFFPVTTVKETIKWKKIAFSFKIEFHLANFLHWSFSHFFNIVQSFCNKWKGTK